MIMAFNRYISWGYELPRTSNSPTTILNNDIPVIVATSAFGMGINKKI